MDSFKQKFEVKIAELCENKQINAFSFITKDEYNKKLKRIIQLKADANIKKENQDYRLLRNYDVMEIMCDGVAVHRLIRAQNKKQIACIEVLFII